MTQYREPKIVYLVQRQDDRFERKEHVEKGAWNRPCNLDRMTTQIAVRSVMTQTEGDDGSTRGIQVNRQCGEKNNAYKCLFGLKKNESQESGKSENVNLKSACHCYMNNDCIDKITPN